MKVASLTSPGYNREVSIYQEAPHILNVIKSFKGGMHEYQVINFNEETYKYVLIMYVYPAPKYMLKYLDDQNIQDYDSLQYTFGIDEAEYEVKLNRGGLNLSYTHKSKGTEFLSAEDSFRLRKEVKEVLKDIKVHFGGRRYAGKLDAARKQVKLIKKRHTSFAMDDDLPF